MSDDLIFAVQQAEYGRLLNMLLEAERAGAKLLAAYVSELPPDSSDYTTLSAVQRDEARNCAVLIHLLLDADVAPSRHGWRNASLRPCLAFPG